MGKYRRGNFIFVTYKGDHDPRHVHIFKKTVEIAKWDLENQKLMRGTMNKRVRALLKQLESEGIL